MKQIFNLSRTSFFIVFALISTSNANARPVTYRGFTITDCKLGTTSFHNARVYFTFRGDTENVQLIQPLIDPTTPGSGTVDILINQTGEASVTIVSGTRAVTANFAPNQIFVSLDQGDTIDAPHIGARGVGFGSLTPTGFEPAYPFAIEDGTIDWGDITNDGFGSTLPLGTPSPEVTQLSLDLAHNTGLSGRAWECVGFPNTCSAATPLHTDKGDFYVYLPYSEAPDYDQGEALSGGTFTATVGEDEDEDEFTPVFHSQSHGGENPISYHAYLISDVTLGAHQYKGAQVYLTFNADASTVAPFSSGHGFENAIGKAHVLIVQGSRAVSANFAPDQLYVYWDIDNASVGIGSNTSAGAQSGYPVTITANRDSNGLTENSLVGAVSDLTLTPAKAANYTAGTATLATDLKNATTVSGAVSSCIGFDPGTSTCSSLTPVPLKTNRGDFYLFEPYRQDGDPSNGVPTYSINWGIFWSEIGPASDD
jgi:hypothetical protein